MKFRAEAGDREVEVNVTRTDGHFTVEIDGTPHAVDARKLEGDFYSLIVDGRSYEISVDWNGTSYFVRHGASEQVVRLADPGRKAREMRAGEGPAKVVSVMPGKVVRLLVSEGDAVEANQGVAVIEAMKMENEIAAPKQGKVLSIDVQPGSNVDAGVTLLVIG